MSIPVSILIPVFNEGKHLNTLLESCIAQDVQEVFIGDNCSTDETEQICRYYEEKYPCVRYVRHPSNLGPFENYMHLIRNTSCDYVAVSGGHDFYTSKDHFKCLFNLCKNNPEAAGAYTGVNYYDEKDHLIKSFRYTFAKDLESNDVFERINSLMKNLSDGSILYGLYKKNNALEISTNNATGLVDLLWVGSHLVKGKLLYSPNIFFGRRIGRTESSAEIYNRYKKIFKTNNYPGFWLKQAMTLAKMLDITESQRNELRQKALFKYELILKRYESK